jgi:hypothetical protein
MAETSASPEVVNRSGRSGNKKERVVSDPLLIVACSLNQSFDDPIGEFNRQFKQAVTASVIGARQRVSRHLVSQSIDWMSGKRRYPDEPRFKGLRTIAMTETSIERDGGVRTEPRCYISSRLLTAQAFTAAARAHWAIETVCAGCSTSPSGRINRVSGEAAEPKTWPSSDTPHSM